jgi:glyoxylase-like metal-dependent hydrolase (beta-lactamase superfamily II)
VAYVIGCIACFGKESFVLSSELKSIEAVELKALLDEGESLFVLDVRNQDEFAAWKVEGRRPATILNIPYFDFIEDADAAIARLPVSKDQPIVLVCAKGGSSEFVADLLREQEYHAINLVGGMQAWGESYLVREVIPASDNLTLLQYDRFGKGCLSYLIASGGEAIVVDPARHYEQYIQEAARRNLRIVHIVDTHLHADHISGAPNLAAVTGAAYHLHEADAQGTSHLVEGTPGRIKLGELIIDVLQEHTPGHTPGSTSLVIDDRFLISGDTLFVNSVGRPDLGGHAEEWAHDLFWTLINKIQALRADTVVLPAHYANQNEVRPDGIVAGELGQIRASNPALQVKDEQAFITFIKENMRPQPEIYGEIRRVNLGLVEACETQRTALELGKNQCAASQTR